MKNILTDKKGFTLFELLITLVIFGMLSSGFFILFNVAIKSWQVGLDNADTQQDARYAMNRMVENIKISQKDSIKFNSNSDIDLGETRYYHHKLTNDLRNQHHNPIASNISKLKFEKVVLIDGKVLTVSRDQSDWDMIKITLEVHKNGEHNHLSTFVLPRN
ncbi:PilW family protein [Natranaerobius thermophilus]|uniref:Prepilin-type N-terminal cleavage/methylation domain-containing protein n=1 Tax=Natranaerobius thermophilus (strain ATCC BAA-1301 / DSM 18059 / JW/NM-WN-LF) TaxID=457570 RepID=B2A560_NATTJ|nr:prepilin-type N-terminal cleavage/methylation domain-containing protein [Natranaerobius thermophilus]ACB85302.1 hypothetical protein Nther_1728 [Natranaerobius thermophilus JW/NM-WN-LF]